MATPDPGPLPSFLDAVTLPHVERGLALAADPELVRFILDQLAIPADRARVAFALGEAEEGPHVVVDRGGRRLACLAAGVRPHAAEGVPRAAVDALGRRHGELRARLAGARLFGGLEKLILRLYHGGEDVSREEIAAAAPVAPLFHDVLVETTRRALRASAVSHQHIAALVRRTAKPKPAWAPALAEYYKTLWYAIHGAVLLAADPRQLRLAVTDANLERLARAAGSMLFIHAEESHAARLLWIAGRLGRRLLPVYTRALAEAEGPMDVARAAMCLGAIAHRHPRRRAAARAALAARPAWSRQGSLQPWADGVFSMIESTFEEPGKAEQALLSIGAHRAVVLSGRWPASTPYRCQDGDPVPNAFSRALAVNVAHSFLVDFKRAVSLFLALPWLARAAPEDVYLPAAHITAVNVPWHPEHTLRLFRPVEERIKADRVKKPDEPTRNGPCPCGSGKKYKRCCGAE
jgi:hypothetical protein